MWTEFLITSLIVVLAPGTGVIFTIGVGLARGFKASILAAVGCTAGILPHMAAALLGVAALLQASALAFQVFKLLGVAYLFYLAWSTLRAGGALNITPQTQETPCLQLARTGFFINVFNPKLSIFFLALLPQLVPSDTAVPLARMLVLSGTFMAMTFAVCTLYGAFAGVVRYRII